MSVEVDGLERGRALIDWFLGWAERGAEGLTDAEIAATVGPAIEPNQLRGFLATRRDLVGCSLIGEPVLEAPGRVVATATRADGASMRVVAVMRADGNAHVVFVKALPEEFVLRDATPADGAALADLCRRTPIVTGEVRTTIDYGDDYLSATALVDGRIVLVVEHDQAIVGLHGGVLHRARIGLDDPTMLYLRHTRIDADAQGHGIFSALNGALFERAFATGATPYSLVAIGNDRMLEKLPEALRVWHWRHTRFSLDTRSLADPSTPVGPVDPDDAAGMINALHDGAALRRPATGPALADRLAHSPGLYGPDRLLGTSGAVIGVSRNSIHVTVEGESSRREAVAFDTGATDIDAFEAVVRHWCHQLAEEDVDDLIVDATSDTPVHERLAGLARSSRDYSLQLASPPPAGATGFRIDPAMM